MTRRLLYTPEHVQRLRQVLVEAKADLHEQIAQQNVEIAELRSELNEMRDALLMLISLRRAEAETDVATLRARLLAVLARLERRDPAARLN